MKFHAVPTPEHFPKNGFPHAASKPLRSANSSKMAVNRLFLLVRMHFLPYVTCMFVLVLTILLAQTGISSPDVLLRCWKHGRFHGKTSASNWVSFCVVWSCSATASRTQCSKSRTSLGTLLPSTVCRKLGYASTNPLANFCDFQPLFNLDCFLLLHFCSSFFLRTVFFRWLSQRDFDFFPRG